MKKSQAITVRDTNTPTEYYSAGLMTEIPDVGEFPCLIVEMCEDEIEIENIFKLDAVTDDFVYYGDVKGESSIIMLNRELELVGDGFLAENDLTELVQTNDGLLWISNTVKYWQREGFLKPLAITPEIKKMLYELDIEKLTDQEKIIYLAFLNNGPVKYTKAESLIAVILNETDETSEQLASIMEILKKQNINANQITSNKHKKHIIAKRINAIYFSLRKFLYHIYKP